VIVLDEHLQDEQIAAAFEGWYPGRVRSIKTLRPGSVIKGEQAPREMLADVTNSLQADLDEALRLG